MINIEKAKIAFKEFLEEYKDKQDSKYNLKIVHTYHVAEKAKEIAEKSNLTEEDVKLAELIGLLHDIGRFEELKITKELNNLKFDHAMHGSKMLFEKGLIKNFIEDRQYDEIIKKAIENHSKLAIEDNLEPRTLLHSKMIRDADKIDNFRIKREEKVEDMFPKIVKQKEDIEKSTITNKVYETIISKKSVDIHDRKTPLDYFIYLLAFPFDLNFKVSYEIIEQENYINELIDRFNYQERQTKERIEEIRKMVNQWIKEKIGKEE